MNKKNRKGFTIVELVIVIAVIAILATVLGPTFGNVIADSKNTALVQQIKNEHTNYTMEYANSDEYSENVVIKIGEKFYAFENGTIKMEQDDSGKDTGVPAEVDEPHVYYDVESNKLVHGNVGKTDCTTCPPVNTTPNDGNGED